MSPAQADPAVRWWLRRPLIWLAGSVLILFAFAGTDLTTFPHQRWAAAGDRFEGRILGSWDGGVDVPVAYTPSDGGEQVIAIARTDVGSTERVGPVVIHVDPDHPTDAHLAGYDEWQLLIGPLTAYVPLVGAFVLWWWSRRRRMRRSEALASAPAPSFRMVGVPRPGHVSPRRWRMHLYPLDAAVGASPVCTVALIDGADDVRPRTVEVKGQPRPGGEVVVWEPETGKIWWPSGRVLLTGSRKLPERSPYPEAAPWSRWRWVVPVVAAIVMIAAMESGENRDLLLERSQVVAVTVVRGHVQATGPTVVSYRTADGVEREATVRLAGPQANGDRYRLRVDPDHPDRLWQPRTAEPLPGSESSGTVLIGVLAMLVLAIGIVMVRRPRPRSHELGRGGIVQPLR